MAGARTLALVGTLAAGACSPGAFRCDDSAQCVEGGTMGTCQPTGYCSFDDPECESGQRYGRHAPSSVSGMCVPVDVADTGPGTETSMNTTGSGAATSTTMPVATSEDPTAATVTMSTSIGSDTASSTGGTPPFGGIEEVGELAADGEDDDPTLTDDQLILVFNSTRIGLGSGDIYEARRNGIDDPFDPPELVMSLSTDDVETGPEISGDGLLITFASDRPGGLGNADVYVARRASVDVDWDAPQALAELNSSQFDNEAILFAGGLEVFFCSLATSVSEPYTASRDDPTALFETPVVQAILLPGGVVYDCGAWISQDGGNVYFAAREAGNGDIWFGRRVGDAILNAEEVSELSTDANEDDPWVSPDENTIYFARDDVAGVSRIFRATRGE